MEVTSRAYAGPLRRHGAPFRTIGLQSIRHKIIKWSLVVRVVLEAVIRTSWTNQNLGRRFYGCPTLSPTCVNFLRWYDPPMYQRSVQIISGLLRSRNELEEILAMVEEKQRKEVAFLLDVLSRRAIIEELEHLPVNLVAYKMREHLKHIQKAVLDEVIELKKELCL
nr:zinc finger, GRF-type [Tanacetum cinerariifolium]